MEIIYQNKNITYFKELDNGDYILSEDNILKLVDSNFKPKMQWKSYGRNVNQVVELSDKNLVVFCDNIAPILNPNKKRREDVFKYGYLTNIKELKKDYIFFVEYGRRILFKEHKFINLEYNVDYLEDIDKFLLHDNIIVRLVDDVEKYTDEIVLPDVYLYYLGDYKVLLTNYKIFDLKTQTITSQIQMDGKYFEFQIGDYLYYGSIDSIHQYDLNFNLLNSKILDNFFNFGNYIIQWDNMEIYKYDVNLENKEHIDTGDMKFCSKDIFIVDGKSVYKTYCEMPPK